MEEQKINESTRSMFPPRITLKKMSKGYNWEISSSEGDTLKEVIKKIEEANKLMIEKYGKKKE